MTIYQPDLASLGARRDRGQWLSYAGRWVAAVVCTALALAAVFGLDALMHRSFLSIFMLAVMASAWLGGIGPGLLASILSAVAINYFFQEPRFTMAISSVGDAVQLALFMLAAMCISWLVRSRRESRDELREHAEALEVMRERERIAMDLHDGVIQSMYASLLHLTSVRRRLPQTEHAAFAALATAGEDLSRAIGSVRDYIASLRAAPLPDMELTAALEALAAPVRASGIMAVEVRVGREQPLALDRLELVDLLHVAREALSNAARHSNGDRAVIKVSRSGGGLVLSVRDNGRGFDASAAPVRGDGLSNMRQRASRLGGHLIVRSRPGEGTTVIARVPVKDDATHASVA